MPKPQLPEQPKGWRIVLGCHVRDTPVGQLWCGRTEDGFYDVLVFDQPMGKEPNWHKARTRAEYFARQMLHDTLKQLDTKSLHHD